MYVATLSRLKGAVMRSYMDALPECEACEGFGRVQRLVTKTPETYMCCFCEGDVIIPQTKAPRPQSPEPEETLPPTPTT